MKHADTQDASRFAIPAKLNLALSAAVGGAMVGLLWATQQQTSAWGVALCAAGFALTGLPLYALMHEAMHRTLHPSVTVNDAAGFALSALFPGAFTFLRSCHLGHHRRNRTDAELFDGFYPHESAAKKRLTFYALYLGLFWLMVPLATLALLVWPQLMMAHLVQDAPPAAAMANGIPQRHIRRIRWEAAGAVALQALLIWALGLSWWAWAAAYGAYGLCWSSQNYITHAGSPRHVLNGAFNLRAHRLFSLWVLNFNWHLAHHQHPAVPWVHLPHLDDPDRARPSYLWAFIRFWRGPTVCTEPPPQPLSKPGGFSADAPEAP